MVENAESEDEYDYWVKESNDKYNLIINKVKQSYLNTDGGVSRYPK